MITFLVYLLFHIIKAAATAYPEHILLNCGSDSKWNASDGQSWDGDVGSKLSPEINNPNISFPATPAGQDAYINAWVPYTSARIIYSKLSYIFPLSSSGRKILRLYFYPATYSSTAAQSFNEARFLFAVTANQYSLLANFDPYLTVSNLKPRASYFVKEFIITLQKTQALNVTFFPSRNSYAFINGIEVVSIPANPTDIFKIGLNNTAVEALYRINVGGESVRRKDDSGMFREWLQDDNFLSDDIAYRLQEYNFPAPGDSLINNTISLNYTLQTPNYSAPEIVYRTARAAKGWMANQVRSADLEWADLEWEFEVDSGFHYLLRLHFCEFMPNLVHRNGQRVFKILINGEPVEMEADIINWTGGTGIPIFKDYNVRMVADYPDYRSKQDLFLTLRRLNYMVYGPILNGLEIFKLTRIEAAAPSRDGYGGYGGYGDSGRSTLASILLVVGVVVGVDRVVMLLLVLLTLLILAWRRRGYTHHIRRVATAAGVVVGDLILSLALFIVEWRQRRNNGLGRTPSGSTGTSMSSLPVPLSELGRRFLLEEIKTATSDFDAALVIGKGGFGNVYRGYINDDLTITAVAIKRSDPCSSQGAHEFRTEIQMLSTLRHLHLVSLIGYCDEDKEMILVYDYMPHGTLRDHLYRTENPPLTWTQRLEICIGAARGLNYLHNEANPVVLHRDVKSNNILLDGNWVAKISDFGLSKMGAPDESFIHFSTNVKGTFGYLDPEYFSTKKLTRKSDVYAFGVVLFEVLSGRAAVDTGLDEEEHSLATWARYCIKNNQVDKLIDSNLEGQISPACLRLFVGVARRCVDTHPPERPPMADVVVSLEMALGLQRNPSSAQQPDKEEMSSHSYC